MSHTANNIHKAAFALLQQEFGATFKTYRKTPMLQVQPGDLPILAVHMLRERRVVDGQSNQGVPKFIHDITLGFSGAVNMETDKQDQISDLEEWMSLIDDILFSDADFVQLTEGFTAVDRVGQYAKVGETVLYEIRVEINISTRSYFEPRIYDQLATVDIKTIPKHDEPVIETVIKLAAAKGANGSAQPRPEKET